MFESRSTQKFTLSGLRRPAVINSKNKQHVILVRDASYSMDDDGKRIDAQAASEDLVSELSLPENKDGFQVAVVDFSLKAVTVAALQPAAQLEGRVPPITTSGSTNITDGLREAAEILQRAASADSATVRYLRPAIILFTDGGHNVGESPQAIANQLKNEADVVTVAFGPDADLALLRTLATSPQHCYRCSQGRELRAFLAAVGETLSSSLQQGQSATQPLQSIRFDTQEPTVEMEEE